jgi:hypothetical protein
MSQIYPQIDQELYCPDCSGIIKSNGIHWQGAHTCTESVCKKCGNIYLVDIYQTTCQLC